jgi:hypothetical protein
MGVHQQPLEVHMQPTSSQLTDHKLPPSSSKGIRGQINHPRQQTAADHEFEELGDEFFHRRESACGWREGQEVKNLPA